MLCQDIGPTDAPVMLVGEAPGEEEEKTGKPFQGASGRLLRAMLKHCGVEINNCYVTNVMQVRPPGNNFNYFYEGSGKDRIPSKALEQGWWALREKIERLKPKTCILLGGEPLKAVTNLSGITSWRGCFLSYKGVKLLATYHPAAVLREYGLHPIFEMDITKAVLQNPKPWPETIINPTVQQVLQSCQEARSAPLVSFDIETVGKNVRSLAIAYRTELCTKAISIPFISFSSSTTSTLSSVVKLCCDEPGGSSFWSPQNEVIVLKTLSELFQSNTPFVGQNSISFDAPILKDNLRLVVKNHHGDLMHLWHLLYCELPKGLDFICSALLNYPNYWTLKNTTIDREEWEYNARDAIVTLEAYELVEREAMAKHVNNI